MKSKNPYSDEKKIIEDMRQTYSLLFIAVNKLQAQVDAQLGELTSRQLMLLTAIAHCDPSRATIINLASMLGTTKQNITRMVQALCKKDILCSITSEIDKRSVNIQLTEKGRSLFKENVPKGNAYFAKIFKGFSSSDIAMFRGFLEKLTDYDHSHEMHFEKPIQCNLTIDQNEMDAVYEELHEGIAARKNKDR